MRYLIISLFFCFLGCKSFIKKEKLKKVTIVNEVVHNTYFSNIFKDYVYKAKVSFYDKTFGGIFIIKKISEANHRVVFTTEMGNKLFDFSFQNDTFKVNYILKEMDRKILLNILEKDFRLLINEKLKATTRFESDDAEFFETELFNKTCYYKFINSKLNTISCLKNGKEKIKIIFSGINYDTAKNIQILHSNVKLVIQLKSIN